MTWKPGQSLPPTIKPALTREQLREYASASGDHNPIHLDETFAKQAGFDSVIVHGMISMAFLGDYVTLQCPPKSFRLERFKCRFRKVTFPGDVLSCEGEVRSIDENGKVTLSVRTKSQRAEITTEGEAEFTPV